MTPCICPVCKCEVDELFDFFGQKMCDLCLDDACNEQDKREQESIDEDPGHE